MTHIINKLGLVLEGGGMRGVYTCGVLEYFMDSAFYPGYVVGVSAGASNAASYIARQKGRNRRLNLNYVRDWRYMSLRNLFLEKSYFGMDFLFDALPNRLEPMDYETFNNSSVRFVVGTTNCKTGKPVYFEKHNLGERFEVLRATVSLPMIAPIIEYDGYELLDGGISDAIPVHKALSDGCQKAVVVLTRNDDYRKKPPKFTKGLELWYRKYPELTKTLLARSEQYNATLDDLHALEKQGKVLIIRPTMPLSVDRLERNPDKLEALFNQGYADAEALSEKIRLFSENL